MSEKTSVGGSISPLSSRRVLAFLIALSLISIVVLGYIAAASTTNISKSYPVVEKGDLVFVDYVGMFADNPGGWIFDTNKRDVAYNTNLIKSLFFQVRDDAQYAPLNYTAGISENYLKPFVDGVIGMTLYQTKRVIVPIEEAYSLDPDQMEDFSLVMDVPIVQNLTYDEFQQSYKAEPYVGYSVKHIFWEWDATVISVIGNKVYLQSEPTVGQIVSSFGNPNVNPRDGWYQEVISVNPSADDGGGLIKVRNLITSQDAYQKRGLNYNGKSFTLLEVDESENRFTVVYTTDTYVGELANRSLIFDITVTAVRKSQIL